jgi:hypothetical protein
MHKLLPPPSPFNAENAAVATAHALTSVTQLEKQKTLLEAQVQALKAQSTSNSTDIHTAAAPAGVAVASVTFDRE